jgi:hypothetical protein
VTGDVKAAVKVKVEAVKVKALSINYSYTDLLAAAVLFFVVVVRQREVRPIPFCAEIQLILVTLYT